MVFALPSAADVRDLLFKPPVLILEALNLEDQNIHTAAAASAMRNP